MPGLARVFASGIPGMTYLTLRAPPDMVISELLTIAVSKLEAKQGKQDSYAKDHFILQPHGLQERLLGDMPLKAVQLVDGELQLDLVKNPNQGGSVDFTSYADTPSRSSPGAAGGDEDRREVSARELELEALLKTGAWFMKYQKGSKPHARYVFCTPNLDTLAWSPTLPRNGAEGCKTCECEALVEVRVGSQAPMFGSEKQRKELESGSFSLEFESRSLALRLLDNLRDRGKWVEAFQMVKRRHGPLLVTPQSKINLMEEMEVQRLLGSGNFAKVYQGYLRKDPRAVSIKLCELSGSDRKASIVEHEVQVLESCLSPYIVDCFGMWGPDPKNRLWVLLEYCQHGSLVDLLRKCDALLSDQQAAYVCRETMQGLVYLHTQADVLHRDVKAGNVLITASGGVKLTDFGVSVRISEMPEFSFPAGSPMTMAPEVIRGHPRPTANADVWSLGIMLIEILEGAPPLYGLPSHEAMVSIMHEAAPALQNSKAWSKELVDFLSQCLVKDQSRRGSSTNLARHAWLTQPSLGPGVLRPLLDIANGQSAKKALRPERTFSDDSALRARKEPAAQPPVHEDLALEELHAVWKKHMALNEKSQAQGGRRGRTRYSAPASRTEAANMKQLTQQAAANALAGSPEGGAARASIQSSPGQHRRAMSSRVSWVPKSQAISANALGTHQEEQH